MVQTRHLASCRLWVWRQEPVCHFRGASVCHQPSERVIPTVARRASGVAGWAMHRVVPELRQVAVWMLHVRIYVAPVIVVDVEEGRVIEESTET
jgi:hypothetical protein